MTGVSTPDPELVDRVRQRLAATGEPPTPDRVAVALRAEVGAAVLGLLPGLRHRDVA